MKIRFLTSAAEESQWPPEGPVEIALAGRSNAGKSTFLNQLAGQAVAKVSQVPGKTRLLNFFLVNDRYRFVDMPGYGYSARSGSEQVTWAPMIEALLLRRPTMKGVLIFIDGSREWTEDESQLADYLRAHNRPFAVVITKVDRLNQKERHRATVSMATGARNSMVFSTSKDDPKTYEKVEEFIFQNWVKP